MTRKWNMVVDVSRCDNCRDCFLATKDEYIGNEFPGYTAPQPPNRHSWLDIRRIERGCWPIIEANFMPVMCNHCDDAPCMNASKNGAVGKRSDGIVIIDPEKSKGQNEMVEACPYGAIYWNEELQIPQAWIFDAHLLDQGWQKTRVEQVCPFDVFESIKVEDKEMQRLKEEQGLEVLHPEFDTKPRVYYKNLHLITKCFASGSVVADLDGVEECAEGAEVVLRQNGSEVARVTTDIFGEFKIDKLEKHSGPYDLEVRSEPSRKLLAQFDIGDESVYLGKMTLSAAA